MRLLSRVGARVIGLSTLADKAYRLFDRVRSRVVLAVAGDDLLDAYSDLAYGDTPHYRAGTDVFRRDFFHWEEEAIRQFFPPPPARVLVGGAGGGREPFALTRLGYSVVAFEPSPRLVSSLVANDPDRTIRVFLARYEDLPALRPAREHDQPATLPSLGRFEAALFGWSSFSHIRTEPRRIEALKAMASATSGPILLSFFGAHRGEARDLFSITIGFYHFSDEDEIRRVAAAAGLQVRALSMDDRDGRWPYAVVARPTS